MIFRFNSLPRWFHLYTFFSLEFTIFNWHGIRILMTFISFYVFSLWPESKSHRRVLKLPSVETLSALQWLQVGLLLLPWLLSGRNGSIASEALQTSASLAIDDSPDASCARSQQVWNWHCYASFPILANFCSSIDTQYEYFTVFNKINNFELKFSKCIGPKSVSVLHQIRFFSVQIFIIWFFILSSEKSLKNEFHAEEPPVLNEHLDEFRKIKRDFFEPDVSHKFFHFAAMAMEVGFAEQDSTPLQVSLAILQGILANRANYSQGPKINARNLMPFVMLGLDMVQETYDFLKTIAHGIHQELGRPSLEDQDPSEDLLENPQNMVCSIVSIYGIWIQDCSFWFEDIVCSSHIEIWISFLEGEFLCECFFLKTNCFLYHPDFSLFHIQCLHFFYLTQTFCSISDAAHELSWWWWHGGFAAPEGDAPRTNAAPIWRTIPRFGAIPQWTQQESARGYATRNRSNLWRLHVAEGEGYAEVVGPKVQRKNKRMWWHDCWQACFRWANEWSAARSLFQFFLQSPHTWREKSFGCPCSFSCG